MSFSLQAPQRRRGGSGKPKTEFWTGQNLTRVLALICFAVAFMFWKGVIEVFTDNRLVILGMTALFTIAPPALATFLIPWTPGGQYLQRLRWKTLGYAAIVIVSCWFAYIQYNLSLDWWISQHKIIMDNYAWKLAVTVILGFTVVPGLVWSSVDTTTMINEFRQAYLIKKFEIETEGFLNEVRAKRLRATKLAAKGWARMLPQEREEYMLIGEQFVENIDGELMNLAQGIGRVSQEHMEFDGLLEDTGPIVKVLDQAYDMLVDNYEDPPATGRTRQLAVEDTRIPVRKGPAVTRETMREARDRQPKSTAAQRAIEYERY